MPSWGSWSKFSKLEQVGDFSFFGYKSSLLVSKVSFNYVYTFKIHSKSVDVPVDIIKIFNNILMGFKILCQVSNLMSSWGSWSKISKLLQVRDFSFCGSKSSLLKHT